MPVYAEKTSAKCYRKSTSRRTPVDGGGVGRLDLKPPSCRLRPPWRDWRNDEVYEFDVGL